MPYELHNTVKYSVALPPIAATTDNTAYVTSILDTANFDANEFVGLTGTLTDTDMTTTVLVQESNDSGMAGATTVDPANILGSTTAGAPIFSNDNQTFKIGYKGTSRYIRITITPANNTGNVFLAGIWAQGEAKRGLQTAQIN